MGDDGILEISYDEVRKLLELPGGPQLPKYTSQVINVANLYARSTRPEVVGKMSELIKEFASSGGRSFEEWKKWYLRKMPGAIDRATEKLWAMLQKIKDALQNVSKGDVRRWVEDLVLAKTYQGLMLQEAIIKEVARALGGGYRSASPEDESKGIDGWILLGGQEIPVSVKPRSYLESEQHLQEDLNGYLIVYVKKKDKVVVDYSEVLKALRSA